MLTVWRSLLAPVTDISVVRIGEQVAPPPPDPKLRFEKHTVRKGSKRCGPREEPVKGTRKSKEDCWDTETPPRRWKKVRTSLPTSITTPLLTFQKEKTQAYKS
jgi:hypothetical protein